MIDIPHRIHGAGIYTNIGGILMGSMLPYMAAPWIRHGFIDSLRASLGDFQQLVTWTSTSKALVFLICWLTKIAYFVLLTDLMVGDWQPHPSKTSGHWLWLRCLRCVSMSAYGTPYVFIHCASKKGVRELFRNSNHVVLGPSRNLMTFLAHGSIPYRSVQWPQTIDPLTRPHNLGASGRTHCAWCSTFPVEVCSFLAAVQQPKDHGLLMAWKDGQPPVVCAIPYF